MTLLPGLVCLFLLIAGLIVLEYIQGRQTLEMLQQLRHHSPSTQERRGLDLLLYLQSQLTELGRQPAPDNLRLRELAEDCARYLGENRLPWEEDDSQE